FHSGSHTALPQNVVWQQRQSRLLTQTHKTAGDPGVTGQRHHERVELWRCVGVQEIFSFVSHLPARFQARKTLNAKLASWRPAISRCGTEGFPLPRLVQVQPDVV